MKGLVLIVIAAIAISGVVAVAYYPQTHCGQLEGGSYSMLTGEFEFGVQNGTNFWSYSGKDLVIVGQLNLAFEKRLEVCVTSSGPGTTISMTVAPDILGSFNINVRLTSCASSTSARFTGVVENTGLVSWSITLHFVANNYNTGTVDISADRVYSIGPEQRLIIDETIPLRTDYPTLSCDMNNLVGGAYITDAIRA